MLKEKLQGKNCWEGGAFQPPVLNRVNKVTGLCPATLLKKRLRQRCFSNF